MNKQQRSKLEKLIEQVEGIIADIEAMSEEEQEKYDNMPETLQYSERADALQEAVNNLVEAADDLTNWCDDVRSNFEL